MNSLRFPQPSRKARQSAVAIIIVLAFVVLLTGLVVAFFSSSILYRQISNSSANATRTELFAQGAVDSIVGDLKQEIAAGSTVAATPTPGLTIYTPNSLAMVPCPVGTPSPSDKPTLNLVKRSGYNLPFYANPTPSSSATPAPSPYDVTDYPPSNRAANVHSTSISLNGRSISPARWNKHLLLPKATSVSASSPYNSNDSNDTDFTPVNAVAASGSAPATWTYAPDWVLVDRSGKNPTAWNSNMVGSTTTQTTVLGRYAYAIYDEGGLLDVNAAGYPLAGSASGNPLYTASNSDPKSAYKSAIAFADISQLPGISTLTAARQEELINDVVGWRNFASAQPQGTLGSFTFNTQAVSSADPTPAGSIFSYTNLVLGNWTGFLKASNTAPYNNQSDRTFASRQQLLKFLQNGVGQNPASPWSATELAALQDASQYLSTFTRDLEQPSYAPPAGRPRVLNVELGGNNIAPDATGISEPPAPATYDDLINPNFAAVRVPTTVTGGRNDGTDLVAGEPVVKKRFNLNRLAWITWEGPSSQASAATKNALLANGISETMIDQGDAGNIQKYFGLQWLPTTQGGNAWFYNIHNGGGTGAGSIMRLGRPPSVTTPDATHYVQDAGREADFFELLKAAINVGSLGKSAITPATEPKSTDNPPTFPSQYTATEVPANYRHAHDTAVDQQVIQIGANIIDQFDSDSYTTRIVFNDNSGAIEFDGVEDLPYIDYFVNGMLRAEAPGSNPTAYFGNGGGQPTSQDPNTPPNGFTHAPGVGLLLEIPALWNPHDVNGVKQEISNSGGAAPFQRPTNFRVVADSADPVTVAAGNTAAYHSIYVTSAALNKAQNVVFPSQATTQVQPNDSSYHIDYAGPPAGQILTASNTALTFSDSNGTLFREPTLLLRTGGAIGLQVPAHSGGFSSVDADPLGLPSRPEGVPATGPGNPPTDPAGTSFAGIMLGAFPLRFSVNEPTGNVVHGVASVAADVMYSYAAYAGPAGGALNTNLRFPYLTYRAQYQDPSGNWVTYDTKYGRVFIGRIDCPGAVSHMLEPNSGSPLGYNTMNYPWSWSTTLDPRTARFGFMTAVESWQGSSPYCTFASPSEGDSYGFVGYPNGGGTPTYDPNYGGWIVNTAYTGVQTPNPKTGVSFSLRPDNFGGNIGVDYSTLVPGVQPDYRLSTSDDPMLDNPFPKGAAGWSEPVVFTFGFRPRYLFAPGMYTQNNSYVPFFVRRMTTTPQMIEEVNQGQADQDGQGSGCPQPAYYADADGVIRRAMGAYVPPGPQGPNASPPWPREAALNTIGLPMAITQYSPSASQFTPAPAANSPFTQTQSRPLILNRPFRSPAELGYVFSDTPWKNLDFFTPESPDNALLDVFCTTDTDDPMARTAGKVNLNTKQAPVVAAVVSGAYVDDPQLSNATIGTLSTASSSNIASAIGSALTARTADTSLGAGPLQNIADLVGRWVSSQPVDPPNFPLKQAVQPGGGGPLINPTGASPPNTSNTGNEEHDGYVPDARRGDTMNYLYDTHYSDGRRSYAGFGGPDPSAVDPTTNLPVDNSGNVQSGAVPETLSAAYKASTTNFGFGTGSSTNTAIATAINQVKRFHEAPIRALSSAGQTRVWNLLIDVVAQTGRYPQSATKLENFTVEGEQRYWVHLAIDRITGQVIDKQVELVKE